MRSLSDPNLKELKSCNLWRVRSAVPPWVGAFSDTEAFNGCASMAAWKGNLRPFIFLFFPFFPLKPLSFFSFVFLHSLRCFQLFLLGFCILLYNSLYFNFAILLYIVTRFLFNFCVSYVAYFYIYIYTFVLYFLCS